MSDIIEKITNLLNLASNNPSEEEAAVASTMARKLMLKHNIEERDLGHTSSVDYEGGGTIDRDFWRLLMSGVSYMIPAKAILWGTGRNMSFKWAATKINAQVADQMIYFWADQVEKLYKMHLPSGMTKKDRARYRMDFKRNCAITITQRARKLREEQNLEKGIGTSLMVIQSELEVEIDAFLATKNLGKGRHMKVRHDSLGAAHGRQAGHSVNLNKGVT